MFFLEKTRNNISHCIEKGDAKPFYVRLYHVPQSQKETLKEQIHSMSDAKLTVPSENPWSAPMILVMQKTAN
ncbi:hypothetical protein PR048_025580 [Dryococelus australis]|uniref:Uncharacterized protein n=1 Tax=Dryococelus australis TaxID=614101 RepID=A0ABQ9GRP5_9NEOP|nr:hypothetical protein PR048_025580 [Dryococelus australis]